MSWAVIIIGLAILIGVFVVYSRYTVDQSENVVYTDDSYSSEWWWGPLLPWYVGDWDGWTGSSSGGWWGPYRHYRPGGGHHRPGHGGPRPGGSHIGGGGPRPGGGHIGGSRPGGGGHIGGGGRSGGGGRR